MKRYAKYIHYISMTVGTVGALLFFGGVALVVAIIFIEEWKSILIAITFSVTAGCSVYAVSEWHSYYKKK